MRNAKKNTKILKKKVNMMKYQAYKQSNKGL